MIGGLPLRGLVVAAVWLILPLAAVFSHRTLATVISVACLLSLLDRGTWAALRRHRPVAVRLCLAVGPLLLWALVSALWAPSPGRAVVLVATRIGIGAGFAALVAIVLSLSRDEARRLALVVLAGVAAYCLIFGFEVASFGRLTRIVGGFPPGSHDHIVRLYAAGAVLAVLFWPAVAVARGRLGWKAVAGVAMVMMASIAVSYSETGKVAIIVSLVMAAVGWLGGRRTSVAAALLLGAAVLAAPFAFHHVIPPILYGPHGPHGFVVSSMPWLPKHDMGSMVPSAEAVASKLQHRMTIWDFAAEHALEKPVAGWGMDASRAIPGGNENIPGLSMEYLPLHPHNFVLQVWLELGGVGALLLAWIIAAALLWIGGEPDRFRRAAMAGTFGAYVGTNLISYGVWQSWWMLTGVLAAAALALGGVLAREGSAEPTEACGPG